MTNALLTEDMFKKALPAQVKKSVNQKLIDSINTTLSDPEMREAYRENLLSYTNVLQDGKFKIESYCNAVRYVSFKLRGKSNIDAYTCTFPDKIIDFNQRGVEPKDIASYVTAYNKSKLVNLIMEQTLVPMHVLNIDLYQRALNTQADLMTNANSEKVRSDAANSILTHLKPPETKKIELDIGVKQDKTIDELRATMVDLAAQQRKMLEGGITDAKEVAHSKLLIEGECDTVDTP